MGDGQAGASVGVPIWAPFMRTVYDSLNLPWINFKEPQGITRLKICGKSKKISTESCPEVIEEVFLTKYAPTDTCEIHSSPFQKKTDRTRVVF